PGLDRSRREVMAVDVRAADAEEEGAGRDRARVVGQIRYVERSTTDDVPRRERSDDALEVHRRASLPRRPVYGHAEATMEGCRNGLLEISMDSRSTSITRCGCTSAR